MHEDIKDIMKVIDTIKPLLKMAYIAEVIVHEIEKM